MKKKRTIAEVNKHFQDKKAAKKMLEKSVLSSSAVEGIYIKSLNNYVSYVSSLTGSEIGLWLVECWWSDV